MIIEPGDKLEILLTHKGVPYAKTWIFKHEHDLETFSFHTKKLSRELFRDVETFGDETE